MDLDLKTWLKENLVWEDYDLGPPIKSRLTLKTQKVIRSLIETVHARVEFGLYRGDLSQDQVKVTLHGKVLLPETSGDSKLKCYTTGLKELFLTLLRRKEGIGGISAALDDELPDFLERVAEIDELMPSNLAMISREVKVRCLDNLQKLFFHPLLQGTEERPLFLLKARQLLVGYMELFAIEFRKFNGDPVHWGTLYKGRDANMEKAKIQGVVKNYVGLSIMAQKLKSGTNELDFVCKALMHMNEKLKANGHTSKSEDEVAGEILSVFTKVSLKLYRFLAGTAVSNELLFSLGRFRGRWGRLVPLPKKEKEFFAQDRR